MLPGLQHREQAGAAEAPGPPPQWRRTERSQTIARGHVDRERSARAGPRRSQTQADLSLRRLCVLNNSRSPRSPTGSAVMGLLLQMHIEHPHCTRRHCLWYKASRGPQR